MLLYAMLYLSQVRGVNPEGERLGELAVSLDDIKQFRQLDSKTPGHPEYRWTAASKPRPARSARACGNSVGMAIAGKWLAAHFNQPGFEIFDYNVYALCGDGDMMEGVASEAASLAGHLKLSNLCWIYDDNHVTIEGQANVVVQRGCGARASEATAGTLTHVTDANDLDDAGQGLQRFPEDQRPPHADHREQPHRLRIAAQAGHQRRPRRAAGRRRSPAGQESSTAGPRTRNSWCPTACWTISRTASASAGGELRAEVGRSCSPTTERNTPTWPNQITAACNSANCPTAGTRTCPRFPADAKGMATRESSGKVLNAVAENVPWLVGGSADLAGSDRTRLKFEGAGDFQAGSYGGRNLHFGVREHGMAAALNGMAVSKIRPFGGTFFDFSDYMRPSIRLAALMEIPAIYVFTHDSIGVGEDGPTHQPIEQLASLRAMPGLMLMRPGDANEVVEAWKVIMQLQHEPAALVLSRQAVPTFDRIEVRRQRRALPKARTSWPTRPTASRKSF